VSNFGLLDQIAALQWIKENIHEFGGDPGSVTLMGHGTGAACVNYLMVSPVSQGTDGTWQHLLVIDISVGFIIDHAVLGPINSEYITFFANSHSSSFPTRINH
jgi:acetyl esterase/lipase